MEKSKKTIIAEFVNIKGNNMWRVMVKGSKDKQKRGYCKTALSAIKFSYLLKKKFDTPIDSQCMNLLLYVNSYEKVALDLLASMSPEKKQEA